MVSGGRRQYDVLYKAAIPCSLLKSALTTSSASKWIFPLLQGLEGAVHCRQSYPRMLRTEHNQAPNNGCPVQFLKRIRVTSEDVL